MFAKRVLSIDDEPKLSAVIAACLKSFGGWNVLLAKSGREGLSLAGTIARPFDAFLLADQITRILAW